MSDRRDALARTLCETQLLLHNPGRPPSWIAGRVGDAWHTHRAAAQRILDERGYEPVVFESAEAA